MIFFITAMGISSCQRNNLTRLKELRLFSASAASLNEVDHQMRWIAKGWVFEGQNGYLKEIVEGLAEIGEEHAPMEEIGDQSSTQLGHDLDAGIEDSLNSHFYGNSYDHNFLYGFEYDGEEYVTFIYIPDLDSVAKDLPHVVVAHLTLMTHTDSVTGYYLNPSTHQLDSILFLGSDPPTDSFYVWVVSHISVRNKKNQYRPPRDEFYPCSTCYENYYCDTICGENEITCPHECELGNAGYRHFYKLKWKGIGILKDKETYFEKWTAGKYEMYLQGIVLRESGGGTTAKYPFSAYLFNYYHIVNDTPTMATYVINRKSACREKAGGKQKGCPASVKNVNYDVFYYVIGESERNGAPSYWRSYHLPDDVLNIFTTEFPLKSARVHWSSDPDIYGDMKLIKISVQDFTFNSPTGIYTYSKYGPYDEFYYTFELTPF